MNKYRYAAIAIFLIEVYIATYVHDTIIRPYIGDLLAAILVYCTVKSFINTPVLKTAIYVLLFCYLIEISQYFHLVDHLGMRQSRLAHVLLGSYFTWVDMLCYTLGMLIVLAVEMLNPTTQPAL
ncbi:MAG: DUF2809 domain-containing protein [Mucilaginibacter sp.]|uniref:ribosomal maturation YjgA family protein n=1 Tax=Mucilaginibacter sp. TaxID=1882438 RepID=UPI0032652A0F